METRAQAGRRANERDEPLGARWWERVYVRFYDALVQRGRFAYDVYLLLGVLY